MIILVNEQQIDVDEQVSIAALLQTLGYPDRGIAVAHDQAVLPRSTWTKRLGEFPQPLRLEVVTAVQGG